MYNAIIVSQLTYGLSTVQMSPAMLKRPDAFQMRGLRYILKIEHSYYSRISNQEVYDKINIILNKGTDINITWQEFIAAEHFDNPKKIVKLSDYVMQQQNKSLGHVIRADMMDPMRLPTIDSNLNTLGVFIKKKLVSLGSIGSTKIANWFINMCLKKTGLKILRSRQVASKK